MQTFGQLVVERYHELVPIEARCIDFRTEGDPFHNATINAQKLARYMQADINARMPVDVEEAWVLALREPYRKDCLRDLQRRYGFLDVQIPSSEVTDIEGFADLTTNFAGTVKSLSPVLNDGHIGEEDRQFLPSAVAQCEALIASSIGMRARLKKALEGGSQ